MSAMVVERSRALLAVTGRDPVRMIQGLATADIDAITPERGAYTTFLTAKGKMVADARVFVEEAESMRLLLDTAPDAVDLLAAHIGRFVPPLFARAEDVSGQWAVVGVYGATAGEVAAAALGIPPPDPAAPDETVVRAPDADGFAVSTGITGDQGWDLFVPAVRRDPIVASLLDAGGRPGSPEALEALRVAAGAPRWGRELTADVIPLEAGLLERAISQTKGCYTGQEVIVRILHRGHVNRHLRRLLFTAGAPEPGAELFEPGNPRPRGTVTSAAENEAGALGLGYVRREVEPPAELRLGAEDGPVVMVEALDEG